MAPRNIGAPFRGGTQFDEKKYLIIVELTSTGFSAYSPDLPGCVSTGATRELERNMQEAIEFHLEGMAIEGLPIPEPKSYPSYVEVPA